MNLKRILGTASAVMFAFSAAGCGTMVSVNPDKDNSQIVAEVNGKEIPKSEYYAALDSLASMYGLTAADMNSSENGAAMRLSLLEQVVDSELIYQKAVKDGLVDTSEEHREEVRKEIEKELDEVREQLKEQYATDEEAQSAYDKFIEENGYDDMEARIDSKIRDEAVSEETDKVVDAVVVTEDDAKEYYDGQVEVQKTAIDADPTSYTLYTSQGGNYYNPAGSVYVKNLLIALPDDVQNQISELRVSGDTEEADKLRDEELAKIQAQADAALARAAAGENFDALIEELGDDPGMDEEPAKTYGYMVYEGSNYVDAFEAASLALKRDGQISALVPTDFGYHIIERVADAEGAVPFDSVKDSIIDSQKMSKQSEAYQDFLEELKEGSDIVVYEDRLEVFNA